VVARDHNDLDARLAAHGDGPGYLGPGRVLQPHQPRQGQALFQVIPVVPLRHGPVGNRQDPQPFRGQRVLGPQKLLPQILLQGMDLSPKLHVTAQREKCLQGALGIEDQSLGGAMEYGEPFAVRIEGDLVNPGVGHGHTQDRPGHPHKGQLHGVAEDRWHQLLGEDLRHIAVAEHFDLVGQEFLQRSHGLFGPVLLPEREKAVDQDHAQDGKAKRGHAGPGVLPLGEEGQPGGDPEDQGEEVCEPLQETHAKWRPPDPFHAIGAKLAQAAFGLRARKSGWPTVKALESLFRAELMNLHLKSAMDGMLVDLPRGPRPAVITSRA